MLAKITHVRMPRMTHDALLAQEIGGGQGEPAP